MSEYVLHLAVLCTLYVILGQGLNLCLGLGMLFNLAHVSAYALGAYTTAILSTEFGSDQFFSCASASIAIAGLFAFLIVAISRRLSDVQFAIGTLAFSACVSALLINWKSLTRGVLGIPGIPRPAIGGISLNGTGEFLLLSGTCMAVALSVCWLFIRSRFSRGLRALAEFPEASEALGRDSDALRGVSLVLASMLAGLAGALFAFYLNYIDPSSFSLNEMVFVFTIVIVGRPGSFLGNVAGAVFLVLLPEPLRFLELSSSILGPMRQLLYALILFGVVWWRRESLFPRPRRI